MFLKGETALQKRLKKRNVKKNIYNLSCYLTFEREKTTTTIIQ